MKKKLLILLLAFVMVVGPVIPVSATEVPAVYEDIADIIAGYDDDDIVTSDVLDELYALISDTAEEEKAEDLSDYEAVDAADAQEDETANIALDLAADFSETDTESSDAVTPNGGAESATDSKFDTDSAIDSAAAGTQLENESVLVSAADSDAVNAVLSSGNTDIGSETAVNDTNLENSGTVSGESGGVSDYGDVVNDPADTDENNSTDTENPAEEETPALDPAATQQETVIFMLRFAGMKDSQLSSVSEEENAEQFAYDCNELANSINMFKGFTYEPESECTFAQLNTMFKNAEPLYNALHADKLKPLFINGMAQPIFPYTTGSVTEGYSNEDSDIIRFCVYVETNYDTDDDGKLDLVKTLVQLPRAAMEGDYEAASIFEARPYITGCTSGRHPNVEGGSYDISKMYSQPDARTAEGTITTAEHAKDADSAEWYYYNPYEKTYAYEDLDWYDYYLTRGFAVVESGGLGTKGSDGFETCGTDLEIDAFKCIIEWLHGDRVAYTDKTNNIAIDADWSNGKVGMTGRSYAGTTQFGLATTGVEGLETIVPVAGIASWYEYSNSQGSVMTSLAYSDYLAYFCNGRLQDEDYADTIQDKYNNYLTQLVIDQTALNGDYANAEKGLDHWQIRDYTVEPLMDDWTGIDIPALIVHGLNDTNVKTKQFDLMYKSFDDAGQNVKLLLHQGTHLTPTYPSQKYELKIDGEYYDTILNKWFSHYLYGVNNGIERMANVTVQSNVDGKWDTYNSWKTASKQILKFADVAEGETSAVANRNPARYTFDIPEEVIIQGAVAVHIRAAASAVSEDTPLSGKDQVRMTVELTDKNDSEFDAFVPSRSYLPISTLQAKGAWMGGGLTNYDLVEYVQTKTASKSIGMGYIDIFNPTAGYDSASASVRTELVDGQYYDYTVYIQPTVYTIQGGHNAQLSISIANNSGVALTIDNNATYIEIPTHSDKAPSGNKNHGSSGSTLSTQTEPGIGNTTGSAVQTGSFNDVNTGKWYYSAVEYVASKGIMTGVSGNNFGPDTNTTRGMIVTILHRLENEPASGTAPFTDVKGGYYANAIAWADANGIVTGYGNGLFGPNDAITREQMAAILYRYAKYKGYDVSAAADLAAFSDAENISSYAVDAMKWANAAGLITGVTNSKLVPADNAIRAQAASILMRFCENIEQ